MSREITFRSLSVLTLACSILLGACAEQQPEPRPADGATLADAVSRAAVERTLEAAFQRASQVADSIERLLIPVPLLRPAEESALRSYSNAAQLERARALGVRLRAAGAIDSLVATGMLVPLEAGTPLWVIRELEHSAPFVTPATRELLADLAARFQTALAEVGLPALRLEVTSVLRTPEQQQSLRVTNPNAAAGTSTHEFGTSIDIGYDAFAAPAADTAPPLAGEPWLEPQADRIIAFAVEAAAARKSRELQAILGRVLVAAQEDRDVMVTLERQQPVFHLTLARER